MTDLAAFLLARLAEDEADLGEESFLDDYCDASSGKHYSNARVRAECDAKRRIVELHRDDHQGWCGICLRNGEGYREEWDVDIWPCQLLRLLALPYVDHPDYRDEWKP